MRALMAAILTLGLAGCGASETEGSSAEPSAPTAEEPGAEEAAADESDGESGPYSCDTGQTCHDYNNLPFSGAGSDPVSIAEAREACGDGTWASGGCDFVGVISSCSMAHVSINYREGADLGAAETSCRSSNGIWDGP